MKTTPFIRCQSSPGFLPAKTYYKFILLWVMIIWPIAVWADDARQIAERHAHNWSKSLQAGNVDDVMALYTDQQATLIRPDGQVATTKADITRFWQTLLHKGQPHPSFSVMTAYFNQARGAAQPNIVIARFAISSNTPQKQIGLNSSYDGLVVETILQRQPNGQWQTLLQKWN